MSTTPTPLGYPHAGAGTVEILLEKEDGADYTILFSPDPNNIELREKGQPMQFYYYPKYPRLAKHPDGRFKFSMQVFKSEGDSSTVIGAEGLEEEAGAFTTLTSTIDLPPALLKKAIDKLKIKLDAQYQNQREAKLFGLFSYKKGVDKDFNETNVRPIQLVQNNVSMHIVGEKSPNNPFGGANPWTFNIQGEGAGSTFGLGENAFSILMGRNSASLVKSALETGANNLVVENSIKYKGYMPTTQIIVTVDAQKTHTHFQSQFSAGISWLSVNWEHEYDKILTSGGITTEIITDTQFADAERKKMEEALLTKARDFAFELIKKNIFETEDSKIEKLEKLVEVINHGFSLKCGVKSSTEIKELHFTDTIKFSAIEVMDSKISGSLDPLTTKKGAEAKKDSEQYISEVRLDEDWAKIHVITSLNGGLIRIDKDGEIVNESPVSEVAIDVGYPDSKGNMIWKGSGRMIAPGGTPYITSTSRSGKTIDAIFPAAWNDKSMDKNSFVFDFVKNTKPSKVTVKQSIMFEKDKRIKIKDQEKEFEFTGTKLYIPLPVFNMINYSLSTEELFECDTVEVTLKVDKMSTKKFKFTSDNFEDLIPYKVWYENDYTIKPSEYKVKYTCKGKIGKKSKKITITTGFQTIDYTEGDILFEIPEGTAAQNKDIEKIRAAFNE